MLKSKILFVATSDIHASIFHVPFFKWLTENGWEIDAVFENRGNLKIPHLNRTFELKLPRKISIVYFESYIKLKKIMNIRLHTNRQILYFDNKCQ